LNKANSDLILPVLLCWICTTLTGVSGTGRITWELALLQYWKTEVSSMAVFSQLAYNNNGVVETIPNIWNGTMLSDIDW